MKAPKNFYNAVDQSKLGIDDLFTRTAENESDITALETVVGDINGGLVKDVHDLQDDSRHYHDDIADLKTADVALDIKIDKVIEDTSIIEYLVDFVSTSSMVLLNGKTCKDICDDVVAGKRVVICTSTNNASTGLKKVYYGQNLMNYSNNPVSSSHPVSCTFSGLVLESNALKHYELFVRYTASVPEANSISVYTKTITTT